VSIYEVLNLFRNVVWLAVPVGAALITYTVCMVIRLDAKRTFWFSAAAFVLALVVVALVLVVRWWGRRRRAGTLEAGLATGPGGADRTRGEVEALRKQWNESVTALRRSGAGGGQLLSALPWYVIIGAPASGKSTLLRHSEIDFPVGDAARRGLQGTRNCDWWFSNVGIFLDTAGRYISDESAAEWGQFLELVRKCRKEEPINGVIVAVPADELTRKSPAELDEEGRRIRARLDELIDHLGINFPVWIVVTKVDLIGGFVEYFGAADNATRQQIMGWTQPPSLGSRFDPSEYSVRFRTMIHRLRELRPALVGAAPLRDRPMAFGFPDELATLEEPFGRVLGKIFEPNVFQETPLFRGVYVTSATQTGTPLQRAAQRIRQLLGAGAPAEHSGPPQITRAYFVKDLVHQRIVPDQHMTWTTPQELERGRLRRIGINLFGAAFGVLGLLLVLANGLRSRNEFEAGVEQRLAPFQGRGGAGVDAANTVFDAWLETDPSAFKNLGLAQELRLHLSLLDEERRVFRTSVLEPLAAGFEKDAAAAASVPELVGLVRSFDQVAGALAKAAAVAVPADVMESESGRREHFAAPPADFLADAQDALRSREKSLTDLGALTTPGKYPANFALSVWRNREALGAEEWTARTEAVRKTFVDRFRALIDDLRVTVEKTTASSIDWKAQVEAQRDRFREACVDAGRRLRAEPLAERQLPSVLTDLLRAARGERVAGGPAGAGEDMAALKALQKPEVKELEQACAGAADAVAAIARWEKEAEGRRNADVAAREIRQALDAVAESLADLERLAAAGRLRADPWPAAETSLRGVLRKVDEDLDRDEQAWLAKVSAPLARLAERKTPEEYRAIPDRWGVAVEMIGPALRRNESVRYMLASQEPGCFTQVVTRLRETRRRQRTFSPSTMRDDLAEMLAPLALLEGGLHGVVPVERVDETRAAAGESFGALVEDLVGYWRGRIEAAMPRAARGDPWQQIDAWIAEKGTVRKLAAELRVSFQEGWDDPSVPFDAPAARTLGPEVWEKSRTAAERLSAVATGLESTMSALEQLARRRDPVLAENATPWLASLRGLLMDPPWGAKRLDRDLGSDLVPARDRDDLKTAANAAEDSVLEAVAREMNVRWGGLVRRLQQAQELGVTTPPEVEQERTRFQGDLRALFGDELRLQFGGKLYVVPGFAEALAGAAMARTRREDVSRPMSLEFALDRGAVPSVKAPGLHKYVFICIEYREQGAAEVFRQVWKPNDAARLVLPRWQPGKGVSFGVYMVHESNPQDRRPIAEWTQPDCVEAALLAGGAAASPDLVRWSDRSGGFSDARFVLRASEPTRLHDILSPPTPTGPVQLPQECVQFRPRPQ
jgi:hypothetical protein